MSGGFDIRWAAAYLGLDVEDLLYWLDHDNTLPCTQYSGHVTFSHEDLEWLRMHLEFYKNTWEPMMIDEEKQNPILFMQRLNHFIRFPEKFNFKFRREERASFLKSQQQG